MSTTKQLIKELIETDFEDIPSAAVEKIKGAILDDVGIAFQGYAMQGQTLVDYARDAGGAPESTVVGDGAKVSAGCGGGCERDGSATPATTTRWARPATPSNVSIRRG